MWPFDAAKKVYFWIHLFRSKAMDCGIEAHIDNIEKAKPGVLRFIQAYSELPGLKYIPLRLYIVPLILVSR